jgi:MoxR-like ATPase
MSHRLGEELARLDRMIHCEMLRLRAAYELSLDEFRGLYISDEHVDALVRHRHGPAPEPPEDPPPLAPRSRWALLAERFELSAFEHDVLLIAAAPELDRKYETLFAYLNNEVGRRWPTLDLAARLLQDEDAVWRAMSPRAALLSTGLIEMIPDFSRRPAASSDFAAASAIGRYLRGLDPALPPELHLHDAPDGDAGTPGPLARLECLAADRRAPHVMLVGVAGCGRLEAAGALAARLGRRVLEIDLAAAQHPPDAALREAALIAGLEDALVFARGIEEALGKEAAARRRIAAALDAIPGPVLIAAALDMAWPEPCPEREVVRIVWPEPDAAQRRAAWQAALKAAEGDTDGAALDALTERFRLSGAQIARAARAATTQRRLDGGDPAALPAAALFRAARDQSGDALGELAVRIDRRLRWDELVLPPATLAHLRAVASAIANRGLVQRSWAMGRLSLSPDGLAALFQGASGTGKTMAASVIAGELGLDLYRIELAGVVSKYIGETEKNLDRIFRTARRSNAILLFDEADALFGRRSEVKDAHDRYANLEVAYLLQRMEEHDGPVILATNLAKNMDQAFSRRLHYVVEFPRPDETARELLWRQMLAPPLPCAPDVDPSRLAKVFDLTGGEIRKTALEAAFMAAADSKVVTMAQLVAASTRELQRQGRVISAREIAPVVALAGRAP